MINIRNLTDNLKTLIFACWFWAAFASQSCIAGQTNDVVTITSLGTYKVTRLGSDNMGYVRIAEDDSLADSNARQDHLIMQVLGPDMATNADFEFCSSYGIFTLDLVDLDGGGSREFVLIKGNGRGSGARSEELQIIRLQGQTFHTLVTTPYSGYSGGATGGAKWCYNRRYEHNRNAGTAVRLTLAVTPLSQAPLIDPDEIPQERTKVFEFDARSIHSVISK